MYTNIYMAGSGKKHDRDVALMSKDMTFEEPRMAVRFLLSPREAVNRDGVWLCMISIIFEMNSEQ